MASIRNPRLQVELCCSRNIIYRSLVTASVSFSSLVGADGSTFTICIPAISKEIRARVSISHVIRSRRARTIFCRPSIKEPVTSSGRVRNLFVPSDRDPHEQSCWSLRIRGMSVCPTWCPWRSDRWIRRANPAFRWNSRLCNRLPGRIWAQCHGPSLSSGPRKRRVHCCQSLASSTKCRVQPERTIPDVLKAAPTNFGGSSTKCR